MARELRPDEIEVGMCVTSIRNEKALPDASYEGDAFEVLAVALPFFVMRNVQYPNESSIAIDTRQFLFMQVPDEYRRALEQPQEKEMM